MTKEERKALVATAASIGFDIAGGYRKAIILFQQLRTAPNALKQAGERYVIGYVANRLSHCEPFKTNWSNMDQAAMIEAAADVVAKKSPKKDLPDSEQPDGHRTTVEHKAVRSAQTSLATARKEAGLVTDRTGKGRKPRPASNDSDDTMEGAANSNDAPKFTLAAPKLANDGEASTYLASAIAALLATVDVNADHVSKPWSEFINDTYQRAVTAKLIPSAE